MKPKRKFVSLSIEEVSLVSEPACPQAKIRVTKARPSPAMVALLDAYKSVEAARRLTPIEAAEALWRGSRPLFKAAGIGGPAELAFLVVKLRARGEV